MNSRAIALASSLLLAPCFATGCSSDADPAANSEGAVAAPSLSISHWIARVPPGTAWSDVPAEVRRALEQHARAYFQELRGAWGTEALARKERKLLEAPTPEATANFDRVLQFLMSSEIDEGFVPSRALQSAVLSKQLTRLYLVYVAERRHLLPIANPEFKDWDGSEVREFVVHDERLIGEQKAYAADVESELRRIPEVELNPVERAIREKALFFARQLKRGATGFNAGGDDPRQAGTSAGWLYDYVTLYTGRTITRDDESFLRALNAHTFQELLYVNRGTVDTFAWDFDSYVDQGLLSESGLDPKSNATGRDYLALVGWWKDRVLDHPDATRACTVYTPEMRARIWDAFTADNMANADGQETMESYAATYQATVTERLGRMHALAVDAVEASFPAGSPVLSAAQKERVIAAIRAEARPAAILETTYAALDRATGGRAARAALEADFGKLRSIGGDYAEGETPRPGDVATVDAMWREVKAYLARHYGGLRVDIAALAPAGVRVTTGDNSFASPADGSITIGLGRPWLTASLYSTILHEAKHAIDGKSKAPVIGAAWEGGGLAVEELVWPRFIEEVMASEASLLPHYLLGTEIDNVRLTATTDATLKVFLRDSCGEGAPDTIAFAKQIVQGYGYDDEATLLLRARRAHMGAQYLSYDYGNVIVRDQARWLQENVGGDVVVDPFLLQACGIPRTDKTPGVLAALRSCLGR